MRKLAALCLTFSLLPGCSMVGAYYGGSRATAHNEERARKLERGERLDADEQDEQRPGTAALEGLALGALVDVALVACVASMRNPGPALNGIDQR